MAAIAILLVAGLGSAPAQPKPQNASLRFKGTTNVLHSTVAAFILTNGTGAHIACVPKAIEYETNQTWVSVPLMGQGQRLVRKWTGVPEELLPGQARTFTVPSPYTNCNWRLVFYCQEQRLLFDGTKNVIRHVTATNSAQASSRQFSGRSYLVTSPSIAPDVAGSAQRAK